MSLHLNFHVVNIRAVFSKPPGIDAAAKAALGRKHRGAAEVRALAELLDWEQGCAMPLSFLGMRCELALRDMATRASTAQAVRAHSAASAFLADLCAQAPARQPTLALVA